MAYFSYNFGTNLLRPATVQNNTIYTGLYSSLASPFGGEEINYNFWALGAFAHDASIQLGILNGLGQSAGSITTGYVKYNAYQEAQGVFYSGVPLVLSPVVANNNGVFNTGPFTFSTPLAFQVATGNGIVYLANGGVDTTNSKYISTTFGGAGQVGPYATPAALVTYLNSRLAYSSLTQNFGTFAVIGQAAVGSTTTWGTTWGNLTASPKSFYIYVNDAKVTNTGVQVTMSQSIPLGYTGSYSSPLAYVAAQLTAAIQSAVGSITPSLTATVDATNTYLNLTPTNNRLTGGCYQIRIERVAGDTNSILDWMGWLANTSSTYTEIWDYRSMINFVSSQTTFPTTLTMVGQGSYFPMVFKDMDVTSTVTGMLGSWSFSVPNLTPGVVVYHTRLPLSSSNSSTPWTVPLNFGGNLVANSISVTGNLISTGTTQYTNLTASGLISSNSQNVTNVSHMGQVEGHLVPGYLPNPIFDLDQVAGVIPQQWAVKMSSTVPGVSGTVPTAANITSANGVPNTGTTFLTNKTPTTLIGPYDAVYTKPAVNQQGVFIQSAFTIDYGLMNQWFQIKFPYVTSTNYTSGDLGVFVLDFTTGALLTPTVYLLPASTGTAIPSVFTTYFKADTNSTSYVLVIYQLTTNALLATVEVGGVSVSDMLTNNPMLRAEYFITSNTTIPATGVQINFDTQTELVNMPLSVITLGAGVWKFTPPLPGVWLIKGQVTSATVFSGMVASTTTFALDLYKTNAAYARLAQWFSQNTAGSLGSLSGSASLRLALTDYVDLRLVYSGTTTATPTFQVSGSAPYFQNPRISIEWLGF